MPMIGGASDGPFGSLRPAAARPYTAAMRSGPWDDLRAALSARPARAAARDAGTLEAAVTLVLRDNAGLELLLIKRGERLGDPWSGHMALPGGRRAVDDRDLLDTALRETREEVGLSLARERDILGALDEVEPHSRRLPPIVIAPFVARTSTAPELRLDPAEVAAALWVPLAELRDEAAMGEVLIELEGGPRSFPAFRYREYEIWGLTHRILTQLLGRVPAT